METENIQLYPARTRVVPVVKLIKNLAKQSAENFQDLLSGGEGRVVEKRNHRKHGKIVTTYTIANVDGYDGADPLDEFDYAVLSVCLSDFKALNRHTTPAIVLRGLTGETSKDGGGKIHKDQRDWILNSVHKLMSTVITVDLSDTNEKLGYDGEKKLTAPILPAKYITSAVNGQKIQDVIFFTDESPILKISEARNQIIRYDTALLNVPNLRNTPRIIMLKNYVLRRIHEIKAHKMTPTLTFTDIFKKCQIADADREAKVDARAAVKAIFNHIQTKDVVKTFEVVKKGVAIYAVIFTF